MHNQSSIDYETIAKWAGRLFKLMVPIAIVVFIYASDWGESTHKRKISEVVAGSVTQGQSGEADVGNFSKVFLVNALDRDPEQQILTILEDESRKRGFRVVGIIHYHTPGDPKSEQIADSLNSVGTKYGSQVVVTRVDIVAMPDAVAAEQMKSTTKVIMRVHARHLFEFQGLWPKNKIEQKVEEILHGLERVGKDWLPEVKGMQRRGTPE